MNAKSKLKTLLVALAMFVSSACATVATEEHFVDLQAKSLERDGKTILLITGFPRSSVMAVRNVRLERTGPVGRVYVELSPAYLMPDGQRSGALKHELVLDAEIGEVYWADTAHLLWKR